MVLLLAVIYIVFISLGLPDSVFGAAWPVLHHDMHIAESFASVYSIIVGICTASVSLVAGWAIRKFGTGRVTLASTFLTVVGLAGISFAPNIVVMIIFAVILGYGAGAIDTGLNNFVSLHYKAQHMNWLHCFWGVGVTASPLIMSFFLRGESSWRGGYRAVAVIQFAIFLITLISMPLWKKAEGVKAKGQSEEDKTDVKENKDKSVFELIRTKGLIPSILSLGFYFGMENLLGTWGASYLVHVFSLDASLAARWVSLYFGGIMLGRLAAGFAAMKLDDNALVKCGIGLSAVGMLILLLPIGKAAITGLLLIGFGFGPIFPSVLHNVPERFGKKYSADFTGFHMFGSYGVGFFIQLVFGYTATYTTFKITPFVLLGLALLFIIDNGYALKIIEKSKRNNRAVVVP
ncbi:MAG: MFS transporter [Clostridia bacterium]|nr:MFS transporter [Clostridia bacterium]